MKVNDEKLVLLAQKLNKPLYIVGGYVRNNCIDENAYTDIDLASTYTYDELLPALEEAGYFVVACYKRTGSIVFSDGKNNYEYTRFRKETYDAGGVHSPNKVEPTNDIKQDALRRDFKCNAVYYDIKNDKIVDVLGGIADIKNKVLCTVKEPEQVFKNDGLRLMRLARLSGELDFSPSADVLAAAKKYSDNILGITVERIFDELKKILIADEKYTFSDKDGHYKGLLILSATGVLDYILPELTLGRDMAQRKDYHKYDVLEHSLRCVKYADKSVRLAALLHDIGKPYCKIHYGEFHGHEEEGKRIAANVLKRLKADNETKKRVLFLVGAHMKDLNLDMKTTKLRKYIVDNYEYIGDLLKLKQADYRASKDSDGVSPCVIKWQKLIEQMHSDGTPFSVKDLKISAKDLMELGFKDKAIGKELKKLFNIAVLTPQKNNFSALHKIALKDIQKTN